MNAPHQEPEDWRAAVERLRTESASVLREMFSGHRPLEACSGAEDSRPRPDRQRPD